MYEISTMSYQFQEFMLNPTMRRASSSRTLVANFPVPCVAKYLGKTSLIARDILCWCILSLLAQSLVISVVELIGQNSP